MLDFSYSFVIASLFSLVPRTSTDAAVYCVRNIVVNSATVDLNDILKNVPKSPGVRMPPPVNKSDKVFLYEPRRRNQRLINQLGHFLRPGSVSIPFEKCLATTLGLENLEYPDPAIVSSDQSLGDNYQTVNKTLLKSSLVKVVLPKEIHSDMIRAIKAKGISLRSLFPGVTGLARSLYETDLKYMP